MAPKKKQTSNDTNTTNKKKACTTIQKEPSEERDPLDLEHEVFFPDASLRTIMRTRKKARTDDSPSAAKRLANPSDEANNIFQDICQGFQQDYTKFVEMFCAKGSNQFKSFMEVWNATKFNLIYSGQDTEAIVEEFTEMSLMVVLNDMLSENFSLLRRVCSIYMLYALRNKQPCGVPPTVRITQNYVSCLKSLKEELRNPELVQVNFVFCTLLRDGFFRFVITDTAYGLEKSYRKGIGGKSVDAQTEEINNQFSVTSQLDEVISSTDIGLDVLQKTFQEYYEAKSKLPGTTNMVPLKELQIVDKNLPKSLKQSYDNMYEGESTFYGNKEVILKKKSETVTSSLFGNKSTSGCSDARMTIKKFTRVPYTKLLLQEYCEMVKEVEEPVASRLKVPLMPSSMDMPDV